MAKKDKNIRRKLIPYLLLVFALISTALILVDGYLNLTQALP